MVYNMLIVKFLFYPCCVCFLNEWANIGNFIEPISVDCSFLLQTRAYRFSFASSLFLLTCCFCLPFMACVSLLILIVVFRKLLKCKPSF